MFNFGYIRYEVFASATNGDILGVSNWDIQETDSMGSIQPTGTIQKKKKTKVIKSIKSTTRPKTRLATRSDDPILAGAQYLVMPVDAIDIITNGQSMVTNPDVNHQFSLLGWHNQEIVETKGNHVEITPRWRADHNGYFHTHIIPRFLKTLAGNSKVVFQP